MEMRAPCRFTRPGQLGEAGQACVVRDAQATGEGVAGGIDGCGLNGDKPGPALGTLFCSSGCIRSVTPPSGAAYFVHMAGKTIRFLINSVLMRIGLVQQDVFMEPPDEKDILPAAMQRHVPIFPADEACRAGPFPPFS